MLQVTELTKTYPGFSLKHVSFHLEPGYIMGFIGRNGAGKTTTLKSILNLVRPDAGQVQILGRDYYTNELWCKQQMGVVLGEFDYYNDKHLRTITDVTRRFYPNWSESDYRCYMQQFNLDENKKVKELSQGMRVKYALALALSHQAKLFILDEPTSGLDPVSRAELLTLFQKIVETGERSILFSTHITSDLEKCADYITYIRDGQILDSCDRESFLDQYRLVHGGQSQLTPEVSGVLIGCQRNAFGFTGLVRARDLSSLPPQLQVAPPDLESVMVYREQEVLV